MPRPRRTIPAYRKHKKIGRAAVSIYRADGSRTEILRPGKFGSEQSKAEFERLLCQLRANAGSLLKNLTPSSTDMFRMSSIVLPRTVTSSVSLLKRAPLHAPHVTSTSGMK